jgi:N-acetylglutamate synthase-like GNAT family acetyltransferase
LSIELTTTPSRIDLDAALALLRQTYWAREMTRETLAKAIAHSLCFAILRDDTLVGLARVVTDRATFAYLTDVVIDPAMRGQGLAHRLMEEILGHPDLQGLRRFALITSDAMRLYEDFGFSVGSGQLTYMEKR